MVKHFFAKLFLCEQKKRAVQHAMLVGFLALLCPDKEVHMILKNINETGNSQLANHRSLRHYSRSFRGEQLRNLDKLAALKQVSISIVPATHSLNVAMFAC